MNRSLTLALAFFAGLLLSLVVAAPVHAEPWPATQDVTQMTFLAHAGRNGAGAMTLTGATVGQKVCFIISTVTADGTTPEVISTAGFESAVTIADQLQQTAATDYSTKTLLVGLTSATGVYPATKDWTKVTFLAFTGRNGAGTVTCTGAAVGQPVIGAFGAPSAGGAFVAYASGDLTVSATNQLTQASATNYSTTAAKSIAILGPATGQWPAIMNNTQVVVKTGVGSNGAGACTVTGATVGMRVLAVFGTTTLGGALSVKVPGTDFESSVTVLNQVQQISASDLSASTFWFVLGPQNP